MFTFLQWGPLTVAQIYPRCLSWLWYFTHLKLIAHKTKLQTDQWEWKMLNTSGIKRKFNWVFWIPTQSSLDSLELPEVKIMGPNKSCNWKNIINIEYHSMCKIELHSFWKYNHQGILRHLSSYSIQFIVPGLKYNIKSEVTRMYWYEPSNSLLNYL